jgi:hypothetical protein
VALEQPSRAGDWAKWAAGASIVAGVLLVGLDLTRRRKAAAH